MSPETASRQPAAATADTPKTPPHDSVRPARDSHLESAFERLIGHQATPQDRARLHQVRDSLGLYSNDALWDVLIALQYYYPLYERFPAMIRGAARELLTECKTRATGISPTRNSRSNTSGRRRRRGGASGGRGARLVGEDHSTVRPPDRARGRIRHPLALGAGQRGGDGDGVDPHRRGRPGFRAPARLHGRLYGGRCRGDAAATAFRPPHGPTQQAPAATPPSNPRSTEASPRKPARARSRAATRGCEGPPALAGGTGKCANRFGERPLTGGVGYPNEYRNAALLRRALALDEAEIGELLAVAVADTLIAGSAFTELLGQLLKVDLRDTWTPDQIFVDRVSDKAALQAIAAEVVGRGRPKPPARSCAPRSGGGWTVRVDPHRAIGCPAICGFPSRATPLSSPCRKDAPATR
ncbi:MAG: hypothetical protein IPP10_16350 [Candidatus Competibacteraceae bacterium]|nr:hypothetical protein [Candidatus Competibacteraceae bacterium]